MRSVIILACTGLLALAQPSALAAQTVTAFKTGEQTTGMTKQCFYNALGNRYTKTIGSVELCPLTVEMKAPGAQPPSPNVPPTPTPAVITAMYKSEQTTGMTKQCYYDYLGSVYTKTLSSIDICPLTMNFVQR